MLLNSLVACSEQILAVSKSILRRGSSYVVNEAKDLVFNQTQIGRRLKDGILYAKEAVKVRMKNNSAESASLVEALEEKLGMKSFQAYKNLQNDKNFIKILERYNTRRFPNAKVLEFKNDAEFYQTLIETLGVGPTKAAQIFSNDPKMLEQIERKFGSEFVQAMKNTRSGCIPTRTLEEAQQAISNAFPNENIVVTKQLGVASIGETYLVKRADGSTAVCKMIKKGVDKEQLELEEKILSRLAKEFTESPEELAKIRGQLRTLYRDWAEELNFASEMRYNKLLQQGAKRYKVADITHISEDGSCIIMNKAGGIKMDSLLKMLEDYKSNPTEFATKYAKEIAENPWLKNPEKVAKDLPTVLLKTFDEQFMFVKKGGKTIMHGDPHTGNFFITADESGKLIPEFIDTGSCVTRTTAQVKDDIGFFTNYFVGNSRGVAEYFVRQSGYNYSNKELITRAITKDIQETIFGKKQNIKKFSDVLANINVILEKHGIQVSPDNATAMKAQMQFFSAISQSGKLTGQSLNIMTLMKDIPRASWNMIKTGTNPYGAVKDALKFAFYNQRQAVGTAYQFTIKDVDKVLKSDGSLHAIG